MKILFNLIIVGLFGIELCSPFLLGYLNTQEKKMKASNEYFLLTKQKNENALITVENKYGINGNSINCHSYSDLKNRKK